MAKKVGKSICFVHYGIGWRDGVNSVIKTLAEALIRRKVEVHFLAGETEPFLKDVGCLKLKELIPSKEKLSRKRIDSQARIIARKLAKQTKNFDVVVVENPFLGTYHLPAMAGFSLYAREYKPAKTKVFFRIHDFYADCPRYHKDLKKYFSDSEIRAMVKGKGVDGFFVINRRLKGKLAAKGIPRSKIHYLPNGIDQSIFRSEIEERDKRKIYNQFKLSPDAKIILYPVRVVPRKNIEEAILLTYFIRTMVKGEYVLIISGKVDKHDRLSKKYYEALKKMARCTKVPVIFTKKGLPSERKRNALGKVIFGIGDLYTASDLIVMTSLEEGFGYPYIESWFTKKLLIGRRIDTVIRDFEKSGLNFDWLYKNFLIFDKKNPLQLSEKERMKKIAKIARNFSSNKFRKKLFEDNKEAIRGQVNLVFNRSKRNRIIDFNYKKAKETYAISRVVDRFFKIVCSKN